MTGVINVRLKDIEYAFQIHAKAFFWGDVSIKQKKVRGRKLPADF